MPVVINEFEVITQPPASQAEGAKPPAASTPATLSSGPTPHDVARVMRHQKERFARVRAH